MEVQRKDHRFGEVGTAVAGRTTEWRLMVKSRHDLVGRRGWRWRAMRLRDSSSGRDWERLGDSHMDYD